MIRKIYAALAIAGVLALAGCAGSLPPLPSPTKPSTTTGVHVRLLRTMGGIAATPGVDQIAALAARVPGVTQVQLYEYTQAAQVAADIRADAAAVTQVIVGGSCGANAAPSAAAQASPRIIAMVAVIQASEWCNGYGALLSKNVLRAQETYDPNCLDTAGLGCFKLVPGPGFNPSNLTIIERAECHPCSFVDPDAQHDVILAIRSVTNAKLSSKYGAARGARVPGAINRVIRHRGQPLYR